MRKLSLRALGVLLLFVFVSAAQAGDKKIRVLIVDGQNNHSWQQTTPIMKKALEDCGRFTVDVATTPLEPKGPPAPKKSKGTTPDDLAKYKEQLEAYKLAVEKFKPIHKAYRDEMEKVQPDLSKYDVVLSNYNGDKWSQKLSADLETQLKAGKIALVIVHAANNSFGSWKEYNQMIGMGWRDAKYGDRLKVDDKGNQVRVPAGQDTGSGHRYAGKFNVVIRDPEHPITKGMPLEWAHNNDELYDNMRGPIDNIDLLATAYSKGTMVHEPMIWTVRYGQGRVFHTPMGHDVNAMLCVGFQATLQRGTEWAATGTVTLPLPSNFPTEKKVSIVPAK